MERCVFEKNHWICEALSVKKCDGCAFRKTPEELAEGREKAMKRLLSIEGGKALYRKYHKPERAGK